MPKQERTFQIEFLVDSRTHWLRASDEQTAKLVGSVLSTNQVVKFTEVIETTDSNHPRTIFSHPRY